MVVCGRTGTGVASDSLIDAQEKREAPLLGRDLSAHKQPNYILNARLVVNSSCGYCLNY